ncbi:MAG TPA: ABC transporter ATP-binding protein [Bacillota bacterium]|nr:ABC transporter ATP-binding protein [Bacillota bacterium]
MSKTSIEIVNLSKTYGSHEAVKGIDLHVHQGEIFGFLGPNGAGKTTTIKMMTGLLEPTIGQASLNGINIWENPLKAKQNIAYVPDQPNLYPKLTGWEYLQFVAEIFEMTTSELEKRANMLLETFSLTNRVHDLIESYSHGMKQKIAICGALIHRPDIIFLDEPTVGLDPKSARNLKDLLRSLCDEGMTAFLSTHILEIAEQMCDRVGIINEGELLALGTIDELRERGGQTGASLEEIFLQLTGDQAQQAIIEELATSDNGEQP